MVRSEGVCVVVVVVVVVSFVLLVLFFKGAGIWPLPAKNLKKSFLVCFLQGSTEGLLNGGE